LDVPENKESRPSHEDNKVQKPVERIKKSKRRKKSRYPAKETSLSSDAIP
jgi:hypothetical protein